jgi:hypothetical protein
LKMGSRRWTAAFGPLGAADVVLEIRIAAIDDGVARLHGCEQGLHGFFRGIARRHHDPGGARSGQLADQVVQRRGGDRAFAGEAFDGIGAQIGNHHGVAATHQAARHVGAHAA